MNYRNWDIDSLHGDEPYYEDDWVSPGSKRDYDDCDHIPTIREIGRDEEPQEARIRRIQENLIRAQAIMNEMRKSKW